ncbi:helix-turn-helix transcriptional regulator [Micromonospora sp. NPDC004551]|uniref:helix-turn-helix domain-containing protein n=1 Tax=Micromonospora sp. NPDC004551 TaxID=3154284 RepID=UPI0033AAC572
MAENLTRAVASEIRAEMARREMTQQALAPLIGMSQQALSRRLRGEHPFDTAELERVANALGVPVAEFLPASERVA